MKHSYTVKEMREADRAAIEGGTPSLELMERAGRALAEVVRAAMGRLGISDVLFVCGGGNNGGDGFVAARILLERGLDAAVLCLAEKFSPDCAAEKERFAGEVMTVIPRRRYALVVDCILGTGLTRAPEGAAKQLIEFCGSASYVISADLPSGLSENGIALAPCVRADETVSMGLMKNCLLMADGPDVSGRVMVADIGIPPVSCGAELWEDADAAALFPKRRSNTHKGAFGRACLFAAEAQYTGAVFLAAGACLRSGAGYTELVADEPLYSAAVGKLPACVLRRFEALDGDILSSDCIALGMGAGVSERLYAQIAELMEAYTGTLLVRRGGFKGVCKGVRRCGGPQKQPHAHHGRRTPCHQSDGHACPCQRGERGCPHGPSRGDVRPRHPALRGGLCGFLSLRKGGGDRSSAARRIFRDGRGCHLLLREGDPIIFY